ncbi:MAG TPA: hypothetical protein VMB50_02710 [Myxococcales bacterium]|nr:hypothetical protein [Myxococcales bacterium]
MLVAGVVLVVSVSACSNRCSSDTGSARRLVRAAEVILLRRR